MRLRKYSEIERHLSLSVCHVTTVLSQSHSFIKVIELYYIESIMSEQIILT